MTTTYNATVEVAHHGITPDQVDQLHDQLADYHPALGETPRGWASATITLPAEDLAQACRTAITLVAAAFGAPAIACEVLTEAEFTARQGWDPVPELVSVSEAGALLGVSRQRVLQMIGERKLPATRIGRDFVIPRQAVVARTQGA